jgi:hypothetical protein
MVTQVRTLNFLPEIFQTKSNQQFLKATLDQLVQQPNSQRIQGYIGRRFEYGINPNSSYVTEPSKIRTDYQLEPGVVFTNKDTSVAKDFITYPGLVDALTTEGSPTNNHSNLFSNEFYSWDSFVDLDKITNFSQYYWLTNGPDPVPVTTDYIDTVADYTVTTQFTSYAFSKNNVSIAEVNPTITVVRGGTYTFQVAQGSKFFIQTNVGLSGIDTYRNNVSSRDVYGVVNNGADIGTVTFTVPLSGAQESDTYTGDNKVDLICTIPFNEIHGKRLNDLTLSGPFTGSIDGIGGPLNDVLDGKIIMFYGFDANATGTINSLFDIADFGDADFDLSPITKLSDYFYQINLIDDALGFPIVTLTEYAPIPTDQLITATNGTSFINKNFVKNQYGLVRMLPPKTAALNTLYYQDSLNPLMYGTIRILDKKADDFINVQQDILGQLIYTSPNGVTFTNGLKVTFSENVFPKHYNTGSYYVEGVGTSINLILSEELSVYEPFADSIYTIYDNNKFDVDKFSGQIDMPINKDYITISRNAINRNAWSRGNRWFHIDVLKATASYVSGEIALAALNNKDNRANRPIVEFYPDLKLINQGTVGIGSVDFVDNTSINISGFYSSDRVAGRTIYYPDGSSIPLFEGARIIFTADTDINIRNKVWVANFAESLGVKKSYVAAGGSSTTLKVDDTTDILEGMRITGAGFTSGQQVIAVIDDTTLSVTGSADEAILDGTPLTFTSSPVITLSKALDGDVIANDQVTVSNGTERKGLTYYFDGSNWQQGQQKNYVNQPPKFDVFDKNGISFADQEFYPGSNFTGSTLFEFALGAGADDAVLGFPIKYSSVGNTSDINFRISINDDTFQYVDNYSSITESVNTGYPYNYINRNEYTRELGWKTAVDESFQYQAFNFESTTGFESFTCNVTAKDADTTKWPVIRVYINAETQPSYNYLVTSTGLDTTITLYETPEVGASIQVLVYSDDKLSADAYYTIPANLESNPFNSVITSLNLGDIKGHYQSICINSNRITGTIYGANDYRDLGNLVSYGDKIIQSSAPLTIPAALLRNKDYSLIDALSYSSNEYVKFKTLLMNIIDTGDYNRYQSAAYMLDDALQQIAGYKYQSTPFFWSDMLPARAPYVSNTYTFNAFIDTSFYSLIKTYDFTNANYDGVIIYLTRIVNAESITTQLVKDQDYIISDIEPKVTMTLDMMPGDVIVINEFNQTYGGYVPNTPTKLGLYPSFIPEIVYDESYITPTYFIKGHDGSLTKLYGEYNEGKLVDFRDKVLLEFEKRIYNNLKCSAQTPVTYDDVVPGQFRTTAHSYDEVRVIQNTNFLNWVGQNRIDYKTQYYMSNNKFTYNYNQSRNNLDNKLFNAGNWRGMYQWFYDTTSPHTTPWEMLGLTAKPTWWEGRYGVAPYTSGNDLLWDDITAGINYNDGSPYVIPTRTRPDLRKILPVDESGNLRDPLAALTRYYDATTFNRDWTTNDVSPSEYSYTKSSSYPFDLIKLFALTKPAKFFSLSYDLDLYQYNSEFGQYLYNDRSRISSNATVKYGTGTAQHSYVNWIVDYVQSTGGTGQEKLNELMSNLDVRLIYRLAGFSDKQLMNFYLEKSSGSSKNSSLMVPDNSYSVLLHENQPFDRIVFSGVIVQKTIKGYRVYGNSQNKAYFTTYTPKYNGLYQTLAIDNISISVASSYYTTETVVPYGNEYYSVNGVCEFLLSYGAYLTDQGMQFDVIENGMEVNWKQMTIEFLSWAQTGWQVGSLVNLNPAATKITVNKDSSIVQPLTLHHQNYVLNQDLIPIQTKDLAVERNDTEFVVFPLNSGDTLAYFNANLSNLEHAVVFDNFTLFNDTIFNPVTSLRQYRMLLKGSKTVDWNGTLDAQGFILNQDNVKDWAANTRYSKNSMVKYKNSYYTANSLILPAAKFDTNVWTKTSYDQIQKGLLPNASNRAYESSLYYDTNAANLSNDADQLAFSLIGYRPRDYLAASNLDDISQVNVYKNFIAEKGTSRVANAVQNITLTTGQIKYEVYENWAIKTSEFGGVNNENFIEVVLNEKYLTGNPSTVGIFKDTTDSAVMQQLSLNAVTNYGRSIADENILSVLDPAASSVLPTAGSVHFDDVKMYAYSFDTLKNSTVAISELYQGNYVWVADENSTWKVYAPVSLSSTAAPIRVVNCLNNLNDTATLVFEEAPGLAVNDLFMVINYDDRVNGYYRVNAISNLTSVVVDLVMDSSVMSISGTGIAAYFNPQRVASPRDIADMPLLNNGLTKSKVWVDQDTDGGWAVYQKSINYAASEIATPTSAISFGNGVAYHHILGYFVLDSIAGKIYRYTFSANRVEFSLQETTVIDPSLVGSMVLIDDTLVVSKVDINSKLYVFKLVNAEANSIRLQQTIVITDKSQGVSLSLSGDKNWLYSASTDDAQVEVYKLSTAFTYVDIGFSTSADTIVGDNSFVILDAYPSEFIKGDLITFDNVTGTDTYEFVRAEYDPYAGTTYYVAQSFDTVITADTDIYKAVHDYVSVDTLSVSGLTGVDQFGNSVSTNYDGTKVFVGAPAQNYSAQLVNTGSVYVFTRITQTYEIRQPASAQTTTVLALALSTAPNSYNQIQVKLNGILLSSASDYSINALTKIVTLTTAVTPGDIVDISCVDFVHTQTLNSFVSVDQIRSGVAFGHSLDTNTPSTELIVGAPYDLSTDNIEGSVYRFTNQGKKYGMITGASAVSLSTDATILINGYTVRLPGTGITNIVTAINQASIPNVKAYSTTDAKLVIQLVNTQLGPVNNKLNITVLELATAQALGISEYVNTQVLINAEQLTGPTQYGYSVKFNEHNSFAVGAPVIARKTATTFDFTDDEDYTNDTIFDGNFTRFVDTAVNAGSVFIYDYLPAYNESMQTVGKYVFGQSATELATAGAQTSYYGKTLAFTEYSLVVGCPAYVNSVGTGRVVIFINNTNKPNWQITRKESATVDVSQIQSVQLYDNISNSRTAALDYIDPLQGKLLGVVRENIDYMGSYDPAGYNTDTTANRIVWASNFVGKIWFDTTTTRFVDYHQADTVYDSKYWGTLFPGSTVTVYTWIESDVVPMDYVGSGTAYNLEAYTTTFELDSTGALISKYYYWVRNTNVLYNQQGKTLTDTVITAYITNPQNSGIPYFAAVKPNIYALYNSRQYIKSTNTSLHIGFGEGVNQDSSYNEFKLIRNGYAEDFLAGVPSAYTDYSDPEALYEKLLDSLSGVDIQGKVVPNISLPKMVQTGISVRPTQSFFINRFKALENYCLYANAVLLQYPIAEYKTPAFLGSSNKQGAPARAPAFLTTSGPTFNTSDYWEYIYWWADGYNNNTKIDVEVSRYFGLATLVATEGLVAGVTANSDGKREVYVYSGTAWTRVGLEQGTIQIKSSLWEYDANNIGFGNNFYDTIEFDTYPSIETRYILRALNEEIYVNDLQIHRNKSLILLFEYITSEATATQNNLPWLNKTSLVDVSHTLRDLVQSQTYQQDNINFLEGYLNEVKPYHVVIKEFAIRYTASDTFTHAISDFDLPAKYDADLGRFVTPNLNFKNPVGVGQFGPTDTVWQDTAYTDWLANYGLSLTGLSRVNVGAVVKYVSTAANTIHIDNAHGIPLTGIITIDDEQISYASVDRDAGILSTITRGVNNTEITAHNPHALVYTDMPGVVVLDSGRDYVDPPEITVYIDTNMYPAPNTPARVSAIMSGDKLVGVKILDAGNGYAVTPEIIIEPVFTVSFDSDAINFSLNTISLTSATLKTGDVVKYKSGIGDTVMGIEDQQHYYVGVVFTDELFGLTSTIALYTSKKNALTDNHRIVFTDAGASAGNLLAVTARAVAVATNTPTRQLKTTLKFDRTSYNSKVTVWTAGEYYYSDFTASGNESSSATKLYDSAVTTMSASLQGEVLPVVAVSSALGKQVTVTTDYAASPLMPGQLKGMNVYFYETPAAITLSLLPDGYTGLADPAVIKFSAPKFNTSTIKNQYFIELDTANLGTAFAAGDIITVKGSLLGGVDGTNDATIKVIHTTITNGILIYELYGIAADTFKQYYVKPITDTQLVVYYDAAMVNPVTVPNLWTADTAYTKDTIVKNGATYYIAVKNTTASPTFIGGEWRVTTNPFPYTASDNIYLPEPVIITSGYTRSASSLVTFNKRLYNCVESNNDSTFNFDKWVQVQSDDPTLNALDRIMGYYEPTDDMLGKNLPLLVSGIDYPNNTYYGNNFTGALTLDTILKDQSFYPKGVKIVSVIYDGNKYVAAADGPAFSMVMHSYDQGSTWQVTRIGAQVLGLTDMTYDGQIYMLSTTNVNTPIYISYDSFVWTTVGEFTPWDSLPFDDVGTKWDSTSLSAPLDKLYSIMSHDGLYVAVGDEIISSRDGYGWNRAYDFIGAASTRLNAVKFLSCDFFEGYIAVGTGITNVSASGAVSTTTTQVGTIVTSNDGKNWSELTPAVTAHGLNAVVASTNMIIVAGDAGTLLSTTNGYNYETCVLNAAPITGKLLSGVYAENAFVIVGENGVILVSYDGVTFDAMISGTTETLHTISHTGERFIAAGANTTILSSYDGIVWVSALTVADETTFYEIKGDAFMSGYGPEELVPGVITDTLSIRITTRPGATWDAETYQHTGYTVKRLKWKAANNG